VAGDASSRNNAQNRTSETLSEIIAEAKNLPRLYESAKVGPTLVRADEYPLVVLHKLETTARVEYLAGLTLIADPSLAYASAGHARALVEFMAHVLWIVGRDGTNPRGSPRSRAICLEWTAVAELWAKVHSRSPEWGGTPDTRREITEARDRIAALHKTAGCSKNCHGRRPGSVSTTLTALAKADPDFYMYRDMYDMGSMFIHLQLSDSMLGLVEKGARGWGPAPDGIRASQLVCLIDVYAHGVAAILEITGSPMAADLQAGHHRLVNAPAIRAAFDSSCGV
jgi:hypothetical protein